MKAIKTIKIECETKDYIDWHNITEFQGGLKIRDEADIEKAKTSILKYGWSFPFFVWVSGKTNYCLDGHARIKVLKALEEEGYLIPELPVVYIQAKNKTEAKQKLLRLNSNFGHFTKESVLEFAEDTEAVEDFPELKEGDRDTQCTMTFVLSQEQVSIIKEALKKCGPIEDETNTNGNGNKLAEICKEYLLNG